MFFTARPSSSDCLRTLAFKSVVSSFELLDRAIMAEVSQAEILLSVLRESLKAQVDGMFSDALAGSRSVALLDLPNHDNSGDSLIWLGEVAALRRIGAEIRYVLDDRTYRAEALRKILRDDTVTLLQGGGNFGDLWPQYQRFRERVCEDFLGRRIVFLRTRRCEGDILATDRTAAHLANKRLRAMKVP